MCRLYKTRWCACNRGCNTAAVLVCQIGRRAGNVTTLCTRRSVCVCPYQPGVLRCRNLCSIVCKHLWFCTDLLGRCTANIIGAASATLHIHGRARICLQTISGASGQIYNCWTGETSLLVVSLV